MQNQSPQPTSSRGSEALFEEWRQLQEANPGIRIRPAARTLGVTEVDLVASACDGETVIRLDGSFEPIIQRTEELGYCRAITRNEAVVHETKGRYKNISFKAHTGMILGDNVDLRLFPDSWEYGFAVSANGFLTSQPSLLFFDESGTALHSIQLLDDDRRSEFEFVVDDFRSAEQPTELSLSGTSSTNSDRSIEEVDRAELLDDWERLEDTHEFHGLLQEYEISRPQAFRLARGTYTEPVPVPRIATMLHSVSNRQIPIMVFVRNPGTIQIYTGPIQTVVEQERRYRVRDETFDLRIEHTDLAEAWVVEKPVETGKVTSFEAFSDRGFPCVSFFGARKPDQQENRAWRSLTRDLITEEEE